MNQTFSTGTFVEGKAPPCKRTAKFFSGGVFLASLMCLRFVFGGTSNMPDGFVNPICEGADPWFTQDQGHYLACFSEGNRVISVQISDQLTTLGPKHIVWQAPDTGDVSQEVWAPELHKLGNHWYIYFAASNGQNKNHRTWVLESKNTDPLGPYTLHGPLYTGDDPALMASNRWAIDMTVLEENGRLYAIWSGWQDDQDVQYLYIAPMKDPLAISGPRVRLCANDDYLWERVNEQPGGRGLNEAPEILQHTGRTFLAYSCSGSWQPSYKLGMLQLSAGGDPLNPKNWTKFSQPVFQSSKSTFGVGHNSFVKSPDGTEDWLVYHAKCDRSDGWQRVVYTQPFRWDASGLPLFGQPVAAAEMLPLPSGERRPTVSGDQDFRFRHATDLAGWSYYGHHQLISLQNGSLHLGEVPPGAANEFRCGEKLVLNGGNWSNFTATLYMHCLESQGELGMLFRASLPAVGFDAVRGYYAGYKINESRLIFGFMDGTKWHEIATAAVDEPANSNLALTVFTEGNHFQISLDGHRLIDAQDSTYPSGTVGMRVVNTHAAFSEFRVGSATTIEAPSEKITYTNPVYAGSMPDPSVIRFGHDYYAAGTTGIERTSDGRIFTLLRSHNLVDWEKLGGALNPPFADSARQYWAPELTSNNGKYYIYYAEGGVEPEKFAIRVAGSDHPEGPYNDLGVQLTDCESNRFTIDPFPFRDDDGQWYFFYARNFTNQTSEVHPGTAIVVDRLLDMTRLAGDCHVVVRAKHDWTLYEANRRMDVYDQTFDWHTIEGPCVVKHAGRYYCFYSGANWQTPRYGVDYVVADHPLGPYSQGGDHARVLQGIPDHVRGPGHHSVVFDPDGKTQYILYHTWDARMKTRQMCLDKLQWTLNGPYCVPTYTPQPVP